MATDDAPNLRRLARQLVDVTRRLKHLETVPQLSNSSLDNQGMHVYDAEGNVSVTLGKQSDGTYSARPVAGPTPPAPVGLDAEGDAGLIHASWQGAFWAGAAMPRDFEAVEVLVDGNVHGAIHDPDGGSVTVPAFAGEREVSFRTLSQAGRRSDATGHVTVTVQSKASVQLDEARGRIDEAKADSAEALIRVGEAEATVEAVQGDLDTLETVTLPGAVAELEAADSAVEQALQDARDALESDIATVRTSVDGKSKITQSVDAPPTSYDGAVGDRWERMSSMGSGGRLISNWRWNGTVWVSTIISDAVLGNVDAAKIGTGFLSADRIAAGSISAAQVAVGLAGNMVYDPLFSDPAVSALRVAGGSRWRWVQGAAESYFESVQVDPATAAGFALRGPTGALLPFPSSIGIKYALELDVFGPVVAYLTIRYGNGALNTPGSSIQRDTTSGTRRSVRFVWDPQDYPSVAAEGSPAVEFGVNIRQEAGAAVPPGTVTRVYGARLSDMTGATVIEDGAVTTDKVAANAITSGHLKAGAITTSKLTVTGDMSAAIVNAMSVNTKKLVVTEEAILNHATLIGDTVVDNINVTGKLIGTDGVFTGTVDFENVNVTGLQLVEKLEANSISADLIEGGHFTGETFEGGSFVGGEFRTSDNLPGQVRLADDAYVTHLDGGGVFPGLRITPADASDFSLLPAIGPGVNGLTIYGGRRTGGGSSVVQCNPTASFMRTFRDDSTTAGSIQTSPTASLMRTYREDGAIGGSIQTSPTDAFMQTYGEGLERGQIGATPTSAEIRVVGANNLNQARITADGNTVTLFSATNGQRYLKLNETGIWIETGGKAYNLEETAQDSGWAMATVASGYTAQPNYPPKARKVGNLVYLSGGVSGAGIGANTSQYVLTLPPGYRPVGNSIYVVGGSSTGAACPLFVIQPDGRVSLRTTATTGSYYLMDGLSFIPE